VLQILVNFANYQQMQASCHQELQVKNLQVQSVFQAVMGPDKALSL